MLYYHDSFYSVEKYFKLEIGIQSINIKYETEKVLSKFWW